MEFGLTPKTPVFTSFPTANFPKFLSLNGIVSKTGLGKYFNLFVNIAHSSSLNWKSS